MGNLISFNGELVAAEDAKVAAMSGAALYGNGVFTTIALFDGEPFLWEKHWRRLTDSCKRLGINTVGMNESRIRQDFDSLIEHNDLKAGRARVTIFDETASSFWSPETEPATSVLIMTAERNPPSRPFRLTVSPFTTNSKSPLAAIKTCNYLDKHIARAEARDRGFNEAVQTNERGEIVSASMANIFWTKDGKLFTPRLESGCLPGTTREFVIENFECEEVDAGIDDLRAADEIFLTSAGVGVVAVDEFEGGKMDGTPHRITGLLPTK